MKSAGRCLIILMYLFVIANNIYIVAAESGTIYIEDLQTYTWTTGGGTPIALNMTYSMETIPWDTANFGYISNFAIYMPADVTFAKSYGSSTFQIIDGGTGGGLAWYDQSTKKVYVVFDASDTFISSPLTISYLNKTLWYDITAVNMKLGTDVVGITKPLCIRGINTQCVGTTTVAFTYQDVVAGYNAFDQYTVLYPSNGLFSISILKNSQVATRYRIESLTGLYSAENTFNKIDISEAIFTYGAGIVANVTTLNGNYVKTIINNTVINLPLGYGAGNISFQYATYDLFEYPKIFINLSGWDFSTYTYRYRLKNPSGEIKEVGSIGTGWSGTGNDTSGYSLNSPGVWTIELYACGYGLCDVNYKFLDSDTMIVLGGIDTSFIFFDKQQYNEEQYPNLTYNIDAFNYTDKSSFSIDIENSQGIIQTYYDVVLQNSTIELPRLKKGIYYAKLRGYWLFWTYDLAQGQMTVLKSTTNNITDNTHTAGYGLTIQTSENCWENLAGTIYTPNPTPNGNYIIVYNSTNKSIIRIEVTENLQTFRESINETGNFKIELRNSTKIHSSQTFQEFACSAPTPPTPLISEESQLTYNYFDGLVGLMGFGVSEHSKLLFALTVLTIICVFGYTISNNGMIMSIMAFSGYIWFTYINYIPKWIFIIVVILIAISTKTFR